MGDADTISGGAYVSTGSFVTEGMVVAPCSMHTLAEIATGVSSSLVTRAADVILKERRPLVLMTREAPLSLIHLRNMTTVTEAGATVFPPAPGFYSGPATIEDLVDHTVGRVLDQFGIHADVYPRWTGGTRRVHRQHQGGQDDGGQDG
ncbi:UbiX family flavin prenyltransferase [Propionimicrobium sp. PCR01-08-3]|uniref:UbiX family flavin prenyltransferase n=1 Tax=Propionimicrobium sp. PCR01-08-3 TaxID=3052086 RepID=UPI00255C82BF|nr:UbiX family flavin prenyltransferase [Propionimicrobium sp. PCR01-08-3]WIY83545.1 UbiX family flavin prenyltransferase [Propionimicrobium sp. PCR01-08-3]